MSLLYPSPILNMHSLIACNLKLILKSFFFSFSRAKDQKLREFFEKQFPELKKQREDKERISRVSQRIRSDAEWEEIIDGLQEQEACTVVRIR